MSLLKKYFNQTKDAREAGAGNYFVPGLFLLKCLKMELEETQGTGNQVWFRVHWEIMAFKGCKHPHFFLSDKGEPSSESVSSVGKYEPGQKISTVLDFSSKQYQGAINTIWCTMLSSLDAFKELSYDQIQSGMDFDDVDAMIEQNLCEGAMILTEVINSGMHKMKNRPTDDFSKHISWVPLSRYDGPKWWEDGATASEDDDI